jgi:hypothetical protein
MGEQNYMDKVYCLECMSKHSNRLEHHCEDLLTSSKDRPELRKIAQEMLDQSRDMRKAVDELRIDELAKKRLQSTI